MLYALFSWSGRLGRLAYFGYSFLLVAIVSVLGLILLLPLRNAENGLGVGIAIGAILALMALFGGFCLMAKRLHDLNMTAWHYAWIAFVPLLLQGLGVALRHNGKPFLGPVVMLLGSAISLSASVFLLFWPGTDGANDYGER